MKSRFLFCLALVLGLGFIGCRTASTSLHYENGQSGAVIDGLQMSLSASMANPKDPAFEVTIQNVGDKNVYLNLGVILGNDKEMFPDKIHLHLIDSHGKSRELDFIDPVAIGGRMDDYAVPLGVGSAYTVKLRLDQFCSLATQEWRLQLKPGRYEISAQFQGTGVGIINTGMEWMKVMNFWKGNLQSNPVFIVE
jgi:hypothetical protein